MVAMAAAVTASEATATAAGLVYWQNSWLSKCLENRGALDFTSGRISWWCCSSPRATWGDPGRRDHEEACQLRHRGCGGQVLGAGVQTFDLPSRRSLVGAVANSEAVWRPLASSISSSRYFPR